MHIAAALQANVLFKGFTAPGLEIIAGASAARTFAPGTPLFAENMLADGMFVLAQGRVGLKARARDGREVELGELGPGDHLGELSLIHPGQRLCTATALTPVSAVELRQADFQRLLGTKPQACVKLVMAIVGRFGGKLAENRDAFRSLLEGH